MDQWTPPTVVGHCSVEHRTAQIEALFDALGVPLQVHLPTECWVLCHNADRLELQRPDGVRVGVDFTSGKARHRATEAGHGAGLLKKALGLATFRKRHDRYPGVVDATGGWGQDAWAMATLGCRVTVMEQHPLVHALLNDGLTRARQQAGASEIADRLSLDFANAVDVLQSVPADVVYLDPMYPQRVRKKADSKKGMQFLHALLGPADESQSTQLLHCALQGSASRVVVKRPKGADALPPPEGWQGQRSVTESPNTRFDVYLSVS